MFSLSLRRRDVRFDDRGLVPAIVQQHDTGEVLMMAWMDADALERSLELGETVLYSRSRREQWHKGATSGNTQRIVDLRLDCDGDVLLVLVDQQGDGVACHTGQRSCFHRRLPGSPGSDERPGPPAPPLAPEPPTSRPTSGPTSRPTSGPSSAPTTPPEPTATDRGSDQRPPPGA